MALQMPNAGTITQRFGPSSLKVEPAMYGSSQKAYWQPYSGLTFHPDFHPALDIAAPQGTAIVASEAGKVTQSYYDSTNGGGNKVTVEIRPGVRYTSNHMYQRLVSVGQNVARGQRIGSVGATGPWVTGNHNHFGVEIYADSRTFLWNPSLFLPGGALANDPRIAPFNAKRYIRLNGAGVNIRSAPWLASQYVYATSAASGIFRNGVYLAPLYVSMLYGGSVEGASVNGSPLWYKAWIGGAYRYVHSSLVRFV